MKSTLAAGLSTSRSYTVDRERTIDFMGDAARVYATPMMVRDIEVTCRDLLLEHLDTGEDSVGTRVEVDHLAATLLGMTVTFEAKIVELKGRAVTFEIAGSDGVDAICRGRHMRFVVDVKQIRAAPRRQETKSRSMKNLSTVKIIEKSSAAPGSGGRKLATYCYQCVAGPDLLTVKVNDQGVATEVEPNFAAEAVHPGGGKVCVKAYGLVQKLYNPNRVRSPMKRTNPKKGRNEDPGFVPISWDEALDLVAKKLLDIRATGLLDESGYPRVAASFGGGGTPQFYMGSFPGVSVGLGSDGHGLRLGPGRQVLPLRTPLRRVLAPRRSPSRPTRRTATTTFPAVRTSRLRAASPASGATPTRASAASSACRSSRICRSPAPVRRNGCRSSRRPIRPSCSR